MAGLDDRCEISLGESDVLAEASMRDLSLGDLLPEPRLGDVQPLCGLLEVEQRLGHTAPPRHLACLRRRRRSSSVVPPQIP